MLRYDMNVRLFVALLLSMPFLWGCIGLGVFSAWPTTSEREIEGKEGTSSLVKQWDILYGPPVEEYEDANGWKVKVYSKSRLRWIGVTPVVGCVPLPLIVPAGRSTITVSENSQASFVRVKTRSTDWCWTGCACGLNPGGLFGTGGASCGCKWNCRSY
jgi:hypothetical protein